MMIEREYPAAPTCPAWCGCHAEDAGWDVCPSAVTKTCRKTVQCDGGAEVTLERFATLEDYRVVVDDPILRVFVVDALTTSCALTLGRTIERLADLAGEPVAVAA